MKNSIKKFLVDLYAIDPSLQSMEAELIPLLEALLQQDPAQAPDAAFVAKLRRQLSDKAVAGGNVWSKWLYAFGGAVTVAVVLPVAMIATNQHPLSPQAPLFSNSVQATGKNAFGTLNLPLASNTPEAMSARPGMGGVAAVSDAPVAVEAQYGHVDTKMIMPWPMMTYKYVFSGSITDLTPQIDVYKRTQKSVNVAASSILDRLNIQSVNMGAFDNMNVDSVSFAQRQKFGYQISVNLREATLSIDANWEQWPQSQCQTDACWQAERVKIGDIPADDVILDIANDFMQRHGLGVSAYGKPVVDNAWRRDYERSEDKANAYVPETQRVVYPQLIDGKVVYDQSGQMAGISVSVHVKHKKVMNVYGIFDRSYDKSEYKGVTDMAEIQQYLSRVDNYGYDPAATGGEKPKQATAVLGTPTRAYSVYYRYTQNVSEEFLVPSLIFPVERVEGGDKNSWYPRTTVVVPLATDMLAEQQNYPMPLMMERAVEAPTPLLEAPALR